MLSYEDRIHIARDMAREYREKGQVSPSKKRGRPKYRDYPKHIDDLILRIHRKYRISAVGIGKILHWSGLKIDNRYAREEPNRK